MRRGLLPRFYHNGRRCHAGQTKPAYLLDKPTGQARVRFPKREIDLSKYESPESRDRYEEVLAERFAENDGESLTLTIVDKTLLQLSPVLQALIQLQLLSGARPGEITKLRPCDVSLGVDGAWC